MVRCDARPSRADTWWKMIHSRILASAEAPSFLFQVETDRQQNSRDEVHNLHQGSVDCQREQKPSSYHSALTLSL